MVTFTKVMLYRFALPADSMSNGIDVLSLVSESNGGGNAIGMRGEAINVDSVEVFWIWISINNNLPHLFRHVFAT